MLTSHFDGQPPKKQKMTLLEGAVAVALRNEQRPSSRLVKTQGTNILSIKNTRKGKKSNEKNKTKQ